MHGWDPARRQVISTAVIVAVGIMTNGEREVLGNEVCDSEDASFWTAIRRRLRERGLLGVQQTGCQRRACKAQQGDRPVLIGQQLARLSRPLCPQPAG